MKNASIYAKCIYINTNDFNNRNLEWKISKSVLFHSIHVKYCIIMNLSNKGKNIKIVSIVVSHRHIRLIGKERYILQTYEEISRNRNFQDAKPVIKGSISKFYFYLKWRKCNIDDSPLLRKNRFCHKLYYFDTCCYLKRIRTIVHCVN